MIFGPHGIHGIHGEAKVFRHIAVVPVAFAQTLNGLKGNGGKTQGDQDERTLARISSGKGGMAWLPGMFSRAPR